MKKEMFEEIKELIKDLKTEHCKVNPYPMISEIIILLEEMKDVLKLEGDTKKRRYEMASGLGVLVLDNRPFSNSPVGARVIEFADKFELM